MIGHIGQWSERDGRSFFRCCRPGCTAAGFYNDPALDGACKADRIANDKKAADKPIGDGWDV